MVHEISWYAMPNYISRGRINFMHNSTVGLHILEPFTEEKYLGSGIIPGPICHIRICSLNS